MATETQRQVSPFAQAYFLKLDALEKGYGQCLIQSEIYCVECLFLTFLRGFRVLFFSCIYVYSMVKTIIVKIVKINFE